MTGWLTERLASGGPMPIDAFMRACLTDETHGYYRRHQAIGAAGDFVTAPEISQIFGELIGIWVASCWQQLGKPTAWRLMELGPGRGTMMADMLRALKVLPEAHGGAEVVLVETNTRLEGEQRERLASSGVPVRWCGDAVLEPPKSVPTIVVANEFLDALPIRQLIAKDGQWYERCVALVADGRGSASDLPQMGFVRSAVPVDPAATTLTPHPAGSVCELLTDSTGMLDGLCRALAGASQIHLYIDYGHSGPVLGDTLQAVVAHRYANPLTAPGEQDLSAQVDFTQIAQAAANAGLTPHGPITQAELLGRLGAADRLQRLAANKDARTVHRLQTGLARLMDPSGMGTRFKAIALTSQGLAAPPVF